MVRLEFECLLYWYNLFTNFNSLMVRLELLLDAGIKPHEINFNSLMVRLEFDISEGDNLNGIHISIP